MVTPQFSEHTLLLYPIDPFCFVSSQAYAAHDKARGLATHGRDMAAAADAGIRPARLKEARVHVLEWEWLGWQGIQECACICLVFQ